MISRSAPALPLLFAVCLLACSSTTTSSGSSGQTAPQKACLDTADAVARAAQRCGEDYKANYDAFVQAAAKGNCANILQVRDEASLRQTCIPSLATVACSDLLAGHIDASCDAQLVHQNLGAELTPVDEPR